MTDQTTLQFFSTRLKSLIRKSRISERELCNEIGKSATFLRPWTNPNGPTARKLPDLMVVLDLASVFNVPVEAMVQPDVRLSISPKAQKLVDHHAERMMNELGMAMQRRLRKEQLFAGERPSIGDVINWLEMKGHRISQESPIWDFADLHKIPDPTDNVLYPSHIGAKSAAALKLGVPSPSLLTRMMITGMSPKDRSRFMVHYHHIEDQPRQTRRLKISIDMEEDGIAFDTVYDRLLEKVEDAQGNSWVMCFAHIKEPDQ